MSNLILSKDISDYNLNDISNYISTGGYETIATLKIKDKAYLVDEIKKSQLTGRGGANFKTGLKVESAYNEQSDLKYVICNLDEGEPGNFKDRYLAEHNPHLILEGMILLGHIIGASKGYIFIRDEYNKSQKILEKAIKDALEKGYLDDFDIEIRYGAGSYLCGEEFALISSIEGEIGKTRIKPPYPATKGLFGKPTLLLNAETIANIPYIIKNGASKYTEIGTDSSKGTRLISLSGNVNKRGVFEVPYGVSIKEIINQYGDTFNDIEMIQLGGPSGPLIPGSMIDLKLDNDDFKKHGLTMGAGAIIVINSSFNIFDILRNNILFFKYESCGKCTPCREGLSQIELLLNKFQHKKARPDDLKLLNDLVNTISDASFCGLGQSSVTSVKSALKYFEDKFVEGTGK